MVLWSDVPKGGRDIDSKDQDFFIFFQSGWAE